MAIADESMCLHLTTPTSSTIVCIIASIERGGWKLYLQIRNPHTIQLQEIALADAYMLFLCILPAVMLRQSRRSFTVPSVSWSWRKGSSRWRKSGVSNSSPFSPTSPMAAWLYFMLTTPTPFWSSWSTLRSSWPPCSCQSTSSHSGRRQHSGQQS